MYETIDEQKLSQQTIQGNRECPFGILVKTESRRTMLSSFIMDASIKHMAHPMGQEGNYKDSNFYSQLCLPRI